MKSSRRSWESASALGCALVLGGALLACKGSKPEVKEEPKSAASVPERVAAPAVPACPARYAALPNDGVGEHTCFCAKEAMAGSVWGSQIYTSDSSICAAAQHAGVLTAEGGTVTARSTQGCPSYEGKEQGGVTSSSWPAFPSSFYFPAKGNGKCPASGPCPVTFKSQSATTVSCSCGTINLGASVWGSDTYTTDSNLCAAAVHAGVITTAGGPVVAQQSGGCARYTGTVRNGVTSRIWGAFPSSFYFPEKGDGKCP